MMYDSTDIVMILSCNIFKTCIPEELHDQCIVIGDAALCLNTYMQHTDRIDILVSDDVYRYMINAGYSSVDASDDMISKRVINISNDVLLHWHDININYIRSHKNSDADKWFIESPSSSYCRLLLMINDDRIPAHKRNKLYEIFHDIGDAIDKALI